MTYQTWGLVIPGYSYPSAAQKKLFDKMYPTARAHHKYEREQREKEHKKERALLLAEEKKRIAACRHLFVPTNLNGAYICRHCKKWVESLAAAQNYEKETK